MSRSMYEIHVELRDRLHAISMHAGLLQFSFPSARSVYAIRKAISESKALLDEADHISVQQSSWAEDCTNRHSRILSGEFAHRCPSFSNDPVDESTYEFGFCRCDIGQAGSLKRIWQRRQLVSAVDRRPELIEFLQDDLASMLMQHLQDCGR